MSSDAATASALGSRLRPFHAVMFGLDSGCAHTSAMKAAWGPVLGRDIAYVPCDGSPRERALCATTGVSTTPTLSFGGVQFPGFVPLPRVGELLDLADAVGATLASRGTAIFTRPNCGWCERQRLLLGPLARSIEWVDCDAQRARCAAAGVAAVPAWRVGGEGAPLVPGFRELREVQALALAELPEMRRMAGGGGAC